MEDAKLGCKYIGKCASCTLANGSYQEQLEQKTKKPIEYFESILQNQNSQNTNTPKEHTKAQIFKSATKHFRLRAKFRIYHYKEDAPPYKKDDISYAMSDYDNRILPINECLIVTSQIHKLMPKIIVELNSDSTLKHKLFEINFISDDKGILVTLLYHKSLDENYRQKALGLSHKLSTFGLGEVRIIGRYAKHKILTTSDEVYLSLTINSDKQGKTIKYIYNDDSFIQPNQQINNKMINWIREQVSKIENVKNKTLIELYCGAGNFSLALSDIFKQVLSSEISKKFIALAQINADKNNIKNVSFLRMSAKDFSDSKNKVREFRRCEHINLDDYPLDCVLVDPPRAGLDEISVSFVQQAEYIVYISCNFDTLLDNLKVLLKTHKLVNYALFDQFAYTSHLELGIILQKAH